MNMRKEPGRKQWKKEKPINKKQEKMNQEREIWRNARTT
jgi:hypothetical protein